jgi:bifunctional NMN adenylyltransferase/nudix hydrolase
MANTFDAAVVIGRFQPFHSGHLALIQEALRVAPLVLVVLGSAHAARSPRNPWTHQERAATILGALGPSDQTRVRFIPMRDYFHEPRWRKEVVKAVTELAPSAARIGVVGHFKDATSDYLKGFETWGLLRVPLQGNIHATELRETYFLADCVDVACAAQLDAVVPSSTRKWLAQFETSTHYSALAEELRALKAYHRAWKSAPFPPVFVTVDAVVTCQSHVLLIQRGKAPGKGLWAVPGGFLELAETLHQSALRELREETGLVLDSAASEAIATHVFDHPQRSQRGRTISHGFHFQLSDATLPVLEAADDAAALQWVPISELTAREGEFFDDHFHLLDTFLQLLPA